MGKGCVRVVSGLCIISPNKAINVVLQRRCRCAMKISTLQLGWQFGRRYPPPPAPHVRLTSRMLATPGMMLEYSTASTDCSMM